LRGHRKRVQILADPGCARTFGIELEVELVFGERLGELAVALASDPDQLLRLLRIRIGRQVERAVEGHHCLFIVAAHE